MCADDELHPSLFHFIRITGQLFHIALYLLILERISQVARTKKKSNFAYTRVEKAKKITSLAKPPRGPLLEIDPSARLCLLARANTAGQREKPSSYGALECGLTGMSRAKELTSVILVFSDRR